MAQGSCNTLLDQLRERLALAQWPLPLSRLPEGTALVGGAVRDGLLDRLQEQPDLDLVVPADAIALTQAPDFEPDAPRIHVSVMDLPDGQAGIEWDVRSCTSFKADPGRWQRCRPGQELPR